MICKEAKFKKGSALLIVLGMLSFMVVSAVSFSIYMRQSRAPSSYLRRNIASRYLVKAAVAKAIEALDWEFNTNDDWGPQRFYGVYDDPYPGCVSTPYERNNRERNGNYWFRRVFTPFGLVEEDKTVPTLTLEALAYLPPSIANDARAISRRTRTAQWQSLPHDAGRYAYTVVNVSDCFDINKLTAGNARNSSSSGRISLSSLFLKTLDNPIDIDDNASISIEQALANMEDATVPLVSMADYSLVLSETYSPFRRYIGSTRIDYVSDEDGLTMGSGLFITDTWFPPTNTETSVTLDLEKDGQPFRADLNALMSYDTLTKRGFATLGGQVLEANLGVGMVCLADYLDENSTPLSLALPTVEPTPMIVGVGVPEGFDFMLTPLGTETVTYTRPGPVDPITGEQKEVEVTRTITTTGISELGGNDINISCVVTYPFKRMKTLMRNHNYEYRAVMKVFFAESVMEDCRFTTTAIHPKRDEVWKKFIPNKDAEAVDPGVVTIYGTAVGAPSFSADVKTTDEAVQEFLFRFQNLTIEMPLFNTVQETCDEYPTYNKAPIVTLAGLDRDNNHVLRGYNADAQVIANDDWFTNWQPIDWLKAESPIDFDSITLDKQGQYSVCAAIWIQVIDRDNNNQVVDMVPAYCEDDYDWLDYDGGGEEDRKLGEDMPLLYFKSDVAIDMSAPGLAFATQPDFGSNWGALYVVDPRYNFAPENYYTKSGLRDATKSVWLNDLNSILGKDGRDRDIFMFCSNQGYLQSIGELQFLPHLERLDDGDVRTGKILRGNYVPLFNGRSFATRTAPTTGDFACGKYFWRTYTAYNNGYRDPAYGMCRYTASGTEEYIDPIYSLHHTDGKWYNFVCGGASAFRVNPYSQDNRVIWSVIANTPFDYAVASTNNLSPIIDSGQKPNTFSESIHMFSFNEGVACAQMSEMNITEIADRLSDEFAACARDGDRDWVSAFNYYYNDYFSGWSGRNGDIGDEQRNFLDPKSEYPLDSPLHGVDRKFLYSFWRECFANRQQLYLIFVNAEPASAGGGGIGGVSQLGGRAVALVWRDPEVPTYNAAMRVPREKLIEQEGDNSTSLNAYRVNRYTTPPHRTRVLFFHQFD